MLHWKRGEKTRSKGRYNSIRGKLTVNNTPSYIREPILVPAPEHQGLQGGWMLKAFSGSSSKEGPLLPLPPEGPSQPRSAARQPRGCWPLWPEAPMTAPQGLCSSHRCFPLDFEEVNEQMLGVASTAPFSTMSLSTRQSLLLSRLLPCSCQSGQLSGGILVNTCELIGVWCAWYNFHSVPSAFFSDSLARKKALARTYMYDMKTPSLVCYI